MTALLLALLAAHTVEITQPQMTELVAPDAELTLVATGFRFTEGPVWIPQTQTLLWSDVAGDAIFRFDERTGVSLLLPPATESQRRANGGRGREPNGLAIDAAGRLLACLHGMRQVARLRSLTRPQAGFVTIARAFTGKRFSSPNDLVVHRRGSVFFTDPPYGLPSGDDDPGKELASNGVYRVDPDGSVTLLATSLERPNGIALSPDQETLYVSSSHRPRPVWLAYDVTPGLSLTNERVLFDAGPLARERGRPPGNDGMCVDASGNLFATGPGGVLVLTPDGRHLGTILVPKKASNCAFGGRDGRTLFVTAVTDVYAITTRARGAGF